MSPLASSGLMRGTSASASASIDCTVFISGFLKKVWTEPCSGVASKSQSAKRCNQKIWRELDVAGLTSRDCGIAGHTP
jgi:hypothetical protein